MATTKQKRQPAAKPVQFPKQKRRKSGKSPIWLSLLALVGVAALIAGFAFLVSDDEPVLPSSPAPAEAGGLPDTPDYHSLLVSPDDPDRLFLGTHAGLYETSDGGRTWSQATLIDRDAMNLARTPGKIVWAAGHGVLAKSTDGGETWEEVNPPGLPHLDVHGFAADPSDPDNLYAAIANEGLYRSVDGGNSFSLVSRKVGPGVMALAVTPEGRVLAGDMRQGLFESANGGKTWELRLEEGLMGIAVNPRQPNHVLATGPGILLSRDGGRTWNTVLRIAEGAGPLAWSSSNPKVAYVVGFDSRLYRSADGGESWEPVG